MNGGAAGHAAARLAALATDGPVGVAVSGGGDSTALLVIARDWAAREGRRIEVATVDHRLRPESAAEAATVATLCARLEVPHETLVWSDHPEGGNLPAAARAARYALLGAWARRRGLAAVLLGHTLDDQAETVLMRLRRGAGVDGLSAMAERMERDGVLWLRPLLGLRRVALRDHLRDAGIGWIEDPTNEDVGYERVRARRLIALTEEYGLTAESLAATADRLRGQRAALESLAADLAARALRWGALGQAEIDLAAFAAAPGDTRYRLLAHALGAISGAGYRPRQSALAPVEAILRAGSGKRTLQGCIVAAAAGRATVAREPAAATERVAAADGVVWDGRWTVAGARQGEIARLGAAGEKALAAARRDGRWTAPEAWRAAPRAARLSSPAVWRDGVLIAAPLAGFGAARAALRPPAGFRVTET